MSQRNNRTRNKMSDNLNNFICPICQSILIEPVSMPCTHILCKECFENTMSTTNLVCPLCRKRLSTWLRRTKKENKLVDLNLWEKIQKDFAKEVKNKLDGEEVNTIINHTPPIRQSLQGEIRQEFEMQRKKIEEEELKRLMKEELASLELIKKIQAEELPLIQKQRQESEPVTSATATCSNLNCDLLANKENKKSKTIVDFPSNGKRLIRERNQHLASTDNHENIDRSKVEQNRSVSAVSTSSHDSINQELHHFKPIKIVPRTPSKRQNDGQIVEPKVIKTTAVNINLIYEMGNESSIVSNSLNQKLLAIKNDCLNNSQNYSNDSAFKGCRTKKETLTSGEFESPSKKIKMDTDITTYIEKGEISSEFASEQRRLQQLIEIEHDDMLLALRLQQEWSKEQSFTPPKPPSTRKSTKKLSYSNGRRRSSVRLQPERLCKQRTLDDMFTQTKPHQ